MLSTTDTILFAIKAGLRLFGAMQKAYVDGTRNRTLILPLPRSQGIDWDLAVSFFNEHKDAVKDQYPRAVNLASKNTLTDDEQIEILNIYLAYLTIHKPSLFENSREALGQFTEEELSALVTIRNWEMGEPGVSSPVQRIAGTIVNVAVEYFLDTPGAISEARPQGRALRSFLRAVDDVDFATVETGEIVPSVLVAVLDGVTENPDLFSNGANEQAFIMNIATSMSTSAVKHLENTATTERWEAAAWLGIVSHAIVKGGAETVLSNPQRFLGVSADEAPLVQRVGDALSDLVIGEEKLTFRPLVSSEGFTMITRAVLESFAENPDLLRVGNDGIKKLLGAVAADVSKLKEPWSKDIFPEVVRLILENSAQNMDMLWGKEFQSPDRHLLVTASRILLAEISKKPPPNSRWRFVLSKDQVLICLEGILDEVTDNPNWLIKRAGHVDPILKEAVRAMTSSLRKVDGKKVSAESGIQVLMAGIEAVATRIDFLEEIETSKTAIEGVLDAIFGTVFEDGGGVDANWKLASNSAIVSVVELTLITVSQRTAIDDTVIQSIRDAVKEELEDARPFDPERFEERLDRAA